MERGISLVWPVLASVAVHAMSGIVLPRATASVREAPPSAVAEMNFLELDAASMVALPSLPLPLPEPEVAEPPPTQVAASAVQPAEPHVASPEPPSEPPSESPPATTAATGSASTAPTMTPGATGVTGEPGRTTPSRDGTITVPGGLRIDPRSVAMGAVAADGPYVPRPQARDDGPGETVAEQNRRLSAQHSGFLAARANSRDYITRRGPPDLQRQADGTFAYAGSAFSARILADGSVEFSDRNNVRFGGLGGPSNSVGATVSFDITDALDRRAGNDPHAAERRWFLESTEQMRESMEARHMQQVAARETRRLTGRLERIWGTVARTPEERREALFRIWDDMVEDEQGAPMRRAVLTFVRANLPEGSADAYRELELTRLNADRTSRESFDPY